MKIMLVDDSYESIEMLSMIFKKYGQDTILFSNPIEAREYYKENFKSISLVISDYKMPELRDDDLLLDMILINPDVKFIFYSGSCHDINIDMSLVLNIKGIQSKPAESVMNFVAHAIDIATEEG